MQACDSIARPESGNMIYYSILHGSELNACVRGACRGGKWVRMTGRDSTKYAVGVHACRCESFVLQAATLSCSCKHSQRSPPLKQSFKYTRLSTQFNTCINLPPPPLQNLPVSLGYIWRHACFITFRYPHNIFFKVPWLLLRGHRHWPEPRRVNVPWTPGQLQIVTVCNGFLPFTA